MRYRRIITVPAFVAVLAAWPIAIYIAGMEYRSAVLPLAFGAFVFILASAYVLQSATILGALAGSAVYFVFVHLLPAVNPPPLETSDVMPYIMFAIVGAFFGFCRDAAKAFRANFNRPSE